MKNNPYVNIMDQLKHDSHTWLITGVAGFIGSNLLESLLKMDQKVIGLDNFSTGLRENLDDVRALVTEEQWRRFEFIEGDIRDLTVCKQACFGVDYVLHQAALGSVPRSIEDPIATNANNIDGFLNILLASTQEGVKKFIYAASSSTYGDSKELPKVEDKIGKPLSPYAVTKYVNELYANVFSRNYGIKTIGLRYFNVFGKRQNPNGSYSAVIPRWIITMANNGAITINGDGSTTRDFCYIDNVIQANILAALVDAPPLLYGSVVNIAVGEQTSLLHLYEAIKVEIIKYIPGFIDIKPIFKEFRIGDVRDSRASIEKARSMLGYEPRYRFSDAIPETIAWYLNKNGN